MNVLKLSAGCGENVLLVEEQENLVAYISKALQYNGYTVFTAASFNEALTIFEHEKSNFKLIFSDVVLEDKDGDQLANIFLKEKPDLRVIMGSDYAETLSNIEERDYHFLERPCSVERLLKRIRSIIEDRKKVLDSV